MTDRQRLAQLLECEAALKRTTRGYSPAGVHWRTAMRLLDEVQADLAASTVPNLGPIVRGGKSVLLHDCTHITSGLGWPAFDDGWPNPAGKDVLAPEACVVDDNTSSSAGGNAFYVTGASGLRYWIGHVTTVPALNRKFAKGAKMTTIARIGEGGGPHVHLAVDARKVIGKHLQSHDDYTHGAPLIGVQLRQALA